MRRLRLSFIVVSCLTGLLAQKASEEKVRYVHPSQGRFVTECEFTIKQENDGWAIVSITERGDGKLTLHATYDENNRLTAASVTLQTGSQKQTATVEVTNGKAKVKRDGQDAQEFDAPPGVIVTSAPDWTDTFLLCQRYDRTQGGKQSSPGLWTHPTQLAQRLTFTIERLGTDAIDHDGKSLSLTRFAIRLRGNSAYAAWADAKGRMIRLIPLPFPTNAPSGFVLEGYEKSAAGLRPEA